MKKLSKVLSLFLVSTLLLAGCGSPSKDSAASKSPNASSAPSASDSKSYLIKIAHNSSDTNPIHLGYESFKKLAEEKSQGRIKVQIFPNAQLGAGDEANADMVKNNVIQMSAVPTYTLSALANIKEYKLCDLPYLFESSEKIYKIMEGDIGNELAQKLLTQTGIKANPPYVQGWLKLSTKNKSIRKPEDVKGMKIRTSNSDFYIEMVKSWGANATPMNYGEVFTALQQGTVDGLVTTTPLYIPDKLYEVQKHMTTVNSLAIVHVPIVNNSFYTSLPEDIKKIFDESMEGYIKAVRKYHADAESDAIKKLREIGMEVNELTKEEFNAFKERSAYILEAKADAVGKEFLVRLKSELSK